MTDQNIIEQLKKKLERAQLEKAVLAERSKLLEEQVADAKHREEDDQHIICEVLERQRELNYMLHRANSVLHRIQHASAELSSEFTDLVKELPDPRSPDWDERVAKINELFMKTGDLTDDVQGEVFGRSLDMDKPEPLKPAVDAAAPPIETPIPAPPPTTGEAVPYSPVIEVEPEPVESGVQRTPDIIAEPTDIDVESPIIHVEPVEVAAEPSVEVEPEPESFEEVFIGVERQTQDIEPVEEPVQVEAEQEPETPETAPTAEAEPAGAASGQKLDLLFPGGEAVPPAAVAAAASAAAAAEAAEAAKLGIFARIWRKVTRRRADDGLVRTFTFDEGEPYVSKEPEAVVTEETASVQEQIILDEQSSVGEPYVIERPEPAEEFKAIDDEVTSEPYAVDQPQEVQPEQPETGDQPSWLLYEGTGEPKPFVRETEAPVEEPEIVAEEEPVADEIETQPELEIVEAQEPEIELEEEPHVEAEPAPEFDLELPAAHAAPEPEEPVVILDDTETAEEEGAPVTIEDQPEMPEEEPEAEQITAASTSVIDEVASEFESIQFDLARGPGEAPPSEAGETTETETLPTEEPVAEGAETARGNGISLWKRVKSTATDAVDKRSESAVERAANRNKRRLNRRVSPPNQ